MSVIELHPPRGRRTAVVAAATLAFGTLAMVGPVSLSVTANAAGTVPASTGSLVGALTATGVASVVGSTTTAPATPATATVAASRTTSRYAISPHRVGTKAYSQWFAKTYMAWKYKWTTTAQYTCLVKLWHRESGWSQTSHNRRSGAHGIPQALPGSKMAKAGPNWRTNPATQIKWGLGYVNNRYGTPCGAWKHFQRRGWY